MNIDTERYPDIGVSWFEDMKLYVSSQQWQTEDEDPRGRGVYLCLNVLLDTSGSEQDLKRKILVILAENKIHFNPFNMTIDAISTLNQGVNLGIVIDERDIDTITNSSLFCITNAIKRGKEFLPEIWKEKPLPFDFRAGSDGKGVTIKFT